MAQLGVVLSQLENMREIAHETMMRFMSPKDWKDRRGEDRKAAIEELGHELHLTMLSLQEAAAALEAMTGAELAIEEFAAVGDPDDPDDDDDDDDDE